MVHIQNRRFVRQIGWLLFGFYLLIGSAGLVLNFINDASLTHQESPTLPEILINVALSVWAFMGALLISRQPNNPIGWLFAIMPIIVSLDDFAFGYAYFGSILQPGSLPGVEIMIVWLYWTTQPFGALAATILFTIFPTGRPLSPVWGKLIWISAGAVAVYILAAAVFPNPIIATPFPTDLLGVEGILPAIFEPVALIAFIILMLSVFGSIISLYVRLYRSKGVERQQLKWFAFATTFLIPGLSLTQLSFTMEVPYSSWFYLSGVIITFVSLAGISITATTAILRYRLWDIDIIIRRTLVYGLLTGALALIYFLTIVVLQQILQRFTGQESPLAIVISTLVIAALFSPLRKRIQDFIDKRFYRRHYDAAETLALFSLKIQDEVNIEALVDDLLQVVDRTMNPESLSIWLRED